VIVAGHGRSTNRRDDQGIEQHRRSHPRGSRAIAYRRAACSSLRMRPCFVRFDGLQLEPHRRLEDDLPGALAAFVLATSELGAQMFDGSPRFVPRGG